MIDELPAFASYDLVVTICHCFINFNFFTIINFVKFIIDEFMCIGCKLWDYKIHCAS